MRTTALTANRVLLAGFIAVLAAIPTLRAADAPPRIGPPTLAHRKCMSATLAGSWHNADGCSGSWRR